MKPWWERASRCSLSIDFLESSFLTPKSDTSFPGHISSKSQFFQRNWYRFQEAELHRNQNKTVKNASYDTLCLLDFPRIEQNLFWKNEISLLGGTAIMFSKSWNHLNPFGIWSEIWRKTRFWTFFVDLENRAEQCEYTFIGGLISTIVFFENMELCLLRSHQMLKKHKKFHQKTSK